MREGRKLKHSLFPWKATKELTDVPHITGAEGVYLYTKEGQKLFDMNSGTVCVNVGHSHSRIVSAIQNFAGPHFVQLYNTTEPRLRLEKLLADITPAHIDRFAFFSEASIAMEAATHIAWGYFNNERPYTISVVPCFHGGTTDMLRRGGDPRRSLIPDSEDGTALSIRAPLLFKGTEAEQMSQSLEELDALLEQYGEKTAAFLIEPVAGTSGAHTFPHEYLKEIRNRLDAYNIFFILDETLSGFGRTGKLFAFEHYGVLPDILVMGKGLTSGYVPMSAVGINEELGNFYQEHQLPMGSTYFAHPFCCHIAHTAVSTLLDEDYIQNTAAMERIVRVEMDRLQTEHPSVKEGRIIGLLGALEFQINTQGESFPKGNEVMEYFKSDLKKRGVVCSFRPSLFLVCPPLCVTEKELQLAFKSVDESLAILDAATKE